MTDNRYRTLAVFFEESCTYIAPRSTEAPHITHYKPVSLLLLFPPFFLTAVSGAYLQYGNTGLFDSPPNVTLTVGAIERVYCVQATGAVPTSIEWYNPQGQLVSKVLGDAAEEVNQHVTGSGRTAVLTFKNYNQSQGGKYECRVAGPGNKTERLPVCIGECYTILLTVKLATCNSGVFLVPSIYHLYYQHTIQISTSCR